MAELRIWSFASLPEKQEALSTVIFCQEGGRGADRSSPDRELLATRTWAVGLSKCTISFPGNALWISSFALFPVSSMQKYNMLAVLYLLQFCCLGKEFKSVCMPQWTSDRLMIVAVNVFFFSFSALQLCFIGAMLENEIHVWTHSGSSVVGMLLSREAAREYSGERPGTAWQF